VSYWLVMPAAGSGRRFGADIPKQYADLGGRALIEWSLAVFSADPRCRGIRVALASDDAHWRDLELEDPAGRLQAVTGGAERWLSVAAALESLPATDEDWVLVHDAARPCLTVGELERLLATRERAPDGALLAVPLSDTLKRQDAAQGVEATLPRDNLWRAQTPQMFRVGLLRAALAACREQGVQPTDEAQAVERLGRRPLLVEGEPTNLKVTSQADLTLAAAILGCLTGDAG
jgi:2-C-methyl-D-erythritol 4-phosphate cytidylyltransferase